MNEIITIIQPDAQPWGLLWLLVIPAIVGVIISVSVQGDDDGVAAVIGIMLSIFGTLFMGLVVFGISNTDNWTEAREDALEEIGYTQVEMSGLNFYAVKDSERVEGLLYEVPDSDNLTYQVVIIPPVEVD